MIEVVGNHTIKKRYSAKPNVDLYTSHRKSSSTEQNQFLVRPLAQNEQSRFCVRHVAATRHDEITEVVHSPSRAAKAKASNALVSSC
jgi:hypothetical protein